MKATCDWTGKLGFTSHVGGFEVPMDGARPLGDEKAPTPKQLLLVAICGCTGMDIVSLLKKFRQPVSKFKMEIESDTAKEHPHELKDVKLQFIFEGECDRDKVKEAVKLSQTKYCSVSATVARATEILYSIYLNGEKIEEARADFSSSQN